MTTENIPTYIVLISTSLNPITGSLMFVWGRGGGTPSGPKSMKTVSGENMFKYQIVDFWCNFSANVFSISNQPSTFEPKGKHLPPAPIIIPIFSYF